jgi:cell division septation protein DedD
MAKDISVYIRELLFRHDCLIIPGFGAFIGNYFPSHVDRNEGLFYPPVRRITFNRHLTGNDGLLIGHISSHLNIPYVESRDIVSTWTEELRNRILAGSSVILDHLGTFSLNREGTIIFEPDSTVNYLLSSYGLTSYQRQPVTDFDVRTKMLEHQRKPSVSQPSMKRLLTRAAVIIPVLVALALVPFNDNLFKGKMEESTLNPLAKAELEFNREQIVADTAYVPPEIIATETPAAETSIPVPATTAAQADKEPVNKVPAEVTVVEEIKPSRPAVIVEEYRYMIITGSFKTEDNALMMIEKLRKSGYDPEMTGGPDGYLRVSAISYATIDEAKAAHSRMIQKFPGAWIHKSR